MAFWEPLTLLTFASWDHYVLFGTKYGAVQDFQQGKKCLIGVKETPLDITPLIPLKTLPNPPKLNH